MADFFTFSEGRGAAAEVDTYLQNSTRLPSAGGMKARVSITISRSQFLVSVSSDNIDGIP